MSIPNYQELMLPLLQITSDKQIHTFRQAVSSLSKKFNLTEEEQKELLPSGQQKIIDNRVGWAKTYLKKAGLLSYPKRGTIQITERGLDLLRENLSIVDTNVLRRYIEFQEFQNSSGIPDSESIQNINPENQTPEESIESSFQQIKHSLAN